MLPTAFRCVVFWLMILATSRAASLAEQLAAGEKIFAEKCMMCHQASGLGVPPIYPPLAKSEWFSKKRELTIKALCEGLSGGIEVAGKHYDNVMPAQMLDDQQVADVLTYAGNSWSNWAEPYTAAEVSKVRLTTRYPTYAALVGSMQYRPLPPAPPGFTLKEIAPTPEFFTRLARDPRNQTVYGLGQNGTIYIFNPPSGTFLPLIKDAEYLDVARGSLATMGMTVDAQGGLWVVSNQKDRRVVPNENEIIIWRSSEVADGHPSKLKPWFRTRYPYGVGPYNHGVSHLAFGPDGMLYVNSGSRTDGGEPGEDPTLSKKGEVDITACIWRLDPKASEPKIEVVARGIRNAYGFAWNGAGDFFTFSNGPDYNAPEEMDFIQAGHHYGFPYQFADWSVEPHFPYPYTPVPPPGLKFTPPVMNLGPDGGGSAAGLGTFDAHSCPGGTIWCGDDFPPSLRGRFLMPRFGNLIGAPAMPNDVGFDLLSVKVEKHADGKVTAEVHTVLAPLARPLDVLAMGGGRVLILEYTRPTDFKSQLAWLPGRVLELAPVKP